MVEWSVLGIVLFGLLVHPFVIFALHQFLVWRDRDGSSDRDVITPRAANDTTPSRTVPGCGSRRAD